MSVLRSLAVALVAVAALAGARATAASAESFLPRERVFAADASAVATRPVAGEVVRRFGPPLTRYGAGHRGVDMRAAPGVPVVAALGGTVTFSGRVAGVGWVTVGHGGGLETTYGSLDPRLVQAGDVVAGGSVLGVVAAGASHLDWGAKVEGAYIDPLGLLGRWETYLTTPDEGRVLPALGGAAAADASTVAAPGRLVWPAAGAASSGFGPRVHPVTGEHRLHTGLDIAAPMGAPVRAAAGGTVSFAGVMGGYGTAVTIEHGGDIDTLYAHLSSAAVATGSVVRPGQVVGRVGATGVTTGPHLHFEVRVGGTPLDPVGWLGR